MQDVPLSRDELLGPNRQFWSDENSSWSSVPLASSAVRTLLDQRDQSKKALKSSYIAEGEPGRAL